MRGLVWTRSYLEVSQNVGSPNWISQCQNDLCVDDLGLTQFYENINMGIKQRFCIFAKKVLTILLWFLLFPQLLQGFWTLFGRSFSCWRPLRSLFWSIWGMWDIGGIWGIWRRGSTFGTFATATSLALPPAPPSNFWSPSHSHSPCQAKPGPFVFWKLSH